MFKVELSPDEGQLLVRLLYEYSRECLHKRQFAEKEKDKISANYWQVCINETMGLMLKIQKKIDRYG